MALRDAGFGREARAALVERRQGLVEEDLARRSRTESSIGYSPERVTME